MADVITVDPRQPDAAALAPAAERLRRGGLVAFPTETVYGLGAHALDPAAVRRIFAAKGRPANDPIIIHIAAVGELAALTTGVPAEAALLADRFWPGPLTLVLRRSPAVPDEITAGLPTVAVRMPAHPVARALIAAAGIPIGAPSANLFSRPSPTTAAHVLADLGDRIDIVIDGGPTDIGVESTVLDLSREQPVILRPGAVTSEMLRTVLPSVEFLEPGTSATEPDGHGSAEAQLNAMRSPGMLSKHYSPRAPLTVYEGPASAVRLRMIADATAAASAGRAVGLLVFDEDDIAVGRVVQIGPVARPDIIAARLYAAVRELDASGVDLILARQFPTSDDIGRAIRDRLSRAAAGRVVQCSSET